MCIRDSNKPTLTNGQKHITRAIRESVENKKITQNLSKINGISNILSISNLGIELNISETNLPDENLTQKQLDEISKNVFQKHSKENEKPHLTAITVGDNPASLLYVTRKQEKALDLGVEFNWLKLDSNTSQETLEDVISEASESTDGLIIQLPLPIHLNPEEAINCIPHEVDVDGLTSYNLGSLFSNAYNLIPATSLAVLELLNFYNIQTEDKNIVIAGRSRLVSAPLAKILSSKSYNANVSIIHSLSLIHI